MCPTPFAKAKGYRAPHCSTVLGENTHKIEILVVAGIREEQGQEREQEQEREQGQEKEQAQEQE